MSFFGVGLRRLFLSNKMRTSAPDPKGPSIEKGKGTGRNVADGICNLTRPSAILKTSYSD